MLQKIIITLLLGYKPAQVRKAIAGGIVSAAAAFVPIIADGKVTNPEVGVLVGAFVAGAGAVFGIKNAASK